MSFEDFKNPGAMYRPAPFWSWNDALDADELKRQVHEMKDKGWGGYFMHSRVGLVTGYLSDEWMEMTRVCAKAAKETETYAWLYDEDRWPSGYAGGEITSREEYRSKALVLLKENEITGDDTVLEEVVHENAKWFICRRIAPMGHPRFNGTNYSDLMNPEAVKAFIECTHDRYKEACGEFMGKEIPGIFTDEPCYLYYADYKVPVVPWSDVLPAFFSNLKGYQIEKHLKELFFDIHDYKKCRFDFYDAVTRLFLMSFTKQYYDWCSDNHMIMTGHFMSEDTLIGQTKWIGAAMPHYDLMHWPGIDKLHRHVNQLVTVKQLTSCVDQLGKEKAFCEAYGCVGQQVSFYHRKWITDWQAALGINFVNPHLSLYSMRGERKRDYPANLFYQQPWWKDERKFSDYIARVNLILSKGKREVDILVIHPVSSVWCEYSPLHSTVNMHVEEGIYEKSFSELSKRLMAMKLDFHYGDEILMEKYGRVEKGKIMIGRHAYATVIVPPSCTLRSSTVRLLKEFGQTSDAKRLIMIRPFPERVDGLITDLDLPDGIYRAETLSEALDVVDSYYHDRIRIIDEMTGGNAEGIFCHERSDEDGRYYFIANTDETRELKVAISIPAAGKTAVLDPMTGNAYSMDAKINEGRSEFKVKFYPAGSLIVYIPAGEIETMEMPVYLDCGVEWENSLRLLKALDKPAVELHGPNVLPLNDVTLYMNGKKVLEKQPVSMGWHRHFYTAADGTPFKAEYEFEVLNIPDGEITAVVEVAENLDRITCNGMEVGPCKKPGEQGAFDERKSWKDVNFTKVPLTGRLIKGKNKLVLEGKKVNNIAMPNHHWPVRDFKSHRPTEVEAVYILGNFSVRDEDRMAFMIDGHVDKPDFTDLTSSGYPFYADCASFITEYEFIPAGKKIYIKVNDVKAACVELYINDNFIDLKYWAPYIFEATRYLKQGKNRIRVTAPTTLFNLLGPNRIAGIEKLESVTPRTFIDFTRYTGKYTLFSFGIGGISVYAE